MIFKCFGIKKNVNAISRESQMLMTSAHTSLMSTPLRRGGAMRELIRWDASRADALSHAPSKWRAVWHGRKPRLKIVRLTCDDTPAATRAPQSNATNWFRTFVPDWVGQCEKISWNHILRACAARREGGGEAMFVCKSNNNHTTIIQQSIQQSIQQFAGASPFQWKTTAVFLHQDCPEGALASARRLSKTWLQCYARTASGSPWRSQECLCDSIHILLKGMIIAKSDFVSNATTSQTKQTKTRLVQNRKRNSNQSRQYQNPLEGN